MNITKQDKDILKDLAVKIAEIAELSIHREKIDMWKKLNSLRSVKPMVWINEIPWHEMNLADELQLKTKNDFCKKLEMEMRKIIYQWKHMKADMVVEPKIVCPLIIYNSGFGIYEEADIVKVDEKNDVYSRHFHIQIKDEDDIEKIKMPKITYDKEATEKNYQMMLEIFDGILEVEKLGAPGFWFAPWDELITWLGIQEGLMDLALRPEFIHRCMDRLMQAYNHMLDQYEEMNLLSLNNGNFRIGSGGLGYTDELARMDCSFKKIKTSDLWGSAAAQIFSEVSPEMHEEFALDYEIRWMKRFGLNYYGCCEPLHKKIDILEKIPNLRKISISPWANLDKTVAKVGDRYVLSCKPSPAIFAEESWHPEEARKQLVAILEKTKGCHVEIIMKDISTLCYQPQRLWEWAEIAEEATQEFKW